MEVLSLGSQGANVMLVQSLLAKIGYNPGAIDGILGPQTRQAVVEFQQNNGLVPDGIVGPTTWQLFEKLLLGYDTYTIQPQDTLYKIAASHYTTVNSILTANPSLNPANLP